MREFVPRDQVFPLFSVYSLLLLNNKISSFMPVLTIGIVRDCFDLSEILNLSLTFAGCGKRES